MSQYVTTPNLGLFKPTYRLDAGAWGLHWNANADKLDQVLGPNGPFLPLTGGVLSGPGNLVIQGTLGVQGTLSVAGATSLAGLTMVPGSVLTLALDPQNPLEAATKQYVDGGGGSVPGGPFLSLSGGVLNGPGNLGVQGTLAVTGDTTLSSVAASGNLTVSGNATVNGLTVGAGGASVAGAVIAGSFVVSSGGGSGGVELLSASGHTGYIGFWNPSGIRTGFIGFATNTLFELNCEGLALSVATPNMNLSGAASVAGTISGNGIYSNAGFTLNGTGGGLGYDGTYIYYKQDSGNWSWRYTRSNGTMSYVRGGDNVVLFNIDGVGNTFTPGTMSCHNSISIFGDPGQGSTIWLNLASGQPSQIVSARPAPAGLRWNVQLGNGQGTDNFYIHRYDDAGNYLDAPLTINRATSAWTMLGVVTAGAFSTNGTVTANSGATVGGLYSTAGITADGRMQSNDIMNISGAFYVGNNTAYYMARGNDGNWRFVENNTTNFTVGPAGDVTARGAVYSTYVQSAGQVVAGSSMRVMGVGTNWSNWGSTRYIGFSYNDTNLDVYVDYVFIGTASDERLKTIVGPYERGLAELRQIDPVLYRLKGNDRGIAPDADTQRELNDGPSIRDTEKVHVGFVAQKVEGVFPELVKRRDGVVDGAVVDDVRYVDEGPWMSFAMLNALKEIDARLTALEGKR